jgi:hypothetical protein
MLSRSTRPNRLNRVASTPAPLNTPRTLRNVGANPYWTYLADLNSAESRRSIQGHLDRLAAILLPAGTVPDKCAGELVPWGALRYEHTALSLLPGTTLTHIGGHRQHAADRELRPERAGRPDPRQRQPGTHRLLAPGRRRHVPARRPVGQNIAPGTSPPGSSAWSSAGADARPTRARCRPTTGGGPSSETSSTPVPASRRRR